ncbi:hypothetical protein GCM10011511_49720 [Puia dinghuensis]|uniref:Restriction endonuclease n=2 Tax=Puia dinghuensis TaxID=1792502 RepID=A0A8J2XWH5_9BACT|nr:hypothetical protein GCM10011511_49720 [Puia dinghuensis]
MDVLSHGRYSEYELIYRLSIILANLTIGGKNKLIKSAAFHHLDPSEKGAISYFIGLTVSKVFAEKLLDVPWLLHFDVYRNQLGTTSASGVRQKPDLLGRSKFGDWIILESKGRANTLPRNLLDKGKAQTRTIQAIGGRTPHLRISAVTHFKGNELHFDWADPEGSVEDAMDLNTTPDEYLSLYYRLVYMVLSTHEPFESNGYTLYSYPDLGITIGLLTSIYQAYGQQNLPSVEAVGPLPKEGLPEVAGQRFYVGTDGVAIGMSEDIRQRLRAH